MTVGPSGGGFPWPVSLWLLATMGFAALSVAIVGDVLSPSLLLDLVAFWPFGAVAVLAGMVGVLRGGAPRVVAPVAVLSWMATTMILHLSGAAFLPSMAGGVDGGIGLEGIGAADVIVGPVEAVDISFTHADELVSVTTTREGGNVAPAVITPFVGDGRAEVVVTERPEPGYFLFSGWQMGLGVVDSWNVDVQSNEISLNTEGAIQVDITAAGDGVLTLTDLAAPSVAHLTGGFEVVVPEGVGVVIEGEADTPSDWVETGRGSRSPNPDVTWTIRVVAGSQVAVTYQGP